MPGAASPKIHPDKKVVPPLFKTTVLFEHTEKKRLPKRAPCCLIKLNMAERILGIDPGLGTVGFGWVSVSRMGRLAVGDWGAIVTSKEKDENLRLAEIHADLTELMTIIQPDVVVIEKLFFAKNITNALKVSQARGVILLAVTGYGAPIFEYTPMQVKQAMTGYGRSKKGEVQQMVAQKLEMDCLPRPDDAADALAVAVCHTQHRMTHRHVGMTEDLQQTACV